MRDVNRKLSKITKTPDNSIGAQSVPLNPRRPGCDSLLWSRHRWWCHRPRCSAKLVWIEKLRCSRCRILNFWFLKTKCYDLSASFSSFKKFVIFECPLRWKWGVFDLVVYLASSSRSNLIKVWFTPSVYCIITKPFLVPFQPSVCVWVCGGAVRFGDCYYLGHHLVRAEIKSK